MPNFLRGWLRTAGPDFSTGQSTATNIEFLVWRTKGSRSSGPTDRDTRCGLSRPMWPMMVFSAMMASSLRQRHHVLGRLTTHGFLTRTLEMSSSRRKVRGNPFRDWVAAVSLQRAPGKRAPSACVRVNIMSREGGFLTRLLTLGLNSGECDIRARRLAQRFIILALRAFF